VRALLSSSRKYPGLAHERALETLNLIRKAVERLRTSRDPMTYWKIPQRWFCHSLLLLGGF
jgi:hypothetical protein